VKRIAIGIQYDGAPWQGWQTQPHGLTVQDALQAAIRKFALQDIPVQCAGRTDTGVHAIAQVAHFDTDVARTMQSWVRGVNNFLPPSIAVRWAQEVEPDFHARFSAIGRTYHYYLYNHPVRSPLLQGRAGWAFRPLDAARMQDAAQHLVGRHDFSAFRAAQCQASSPVRSMQSVQVERNGDLLRFTLTANAFLHHMVRNIVGSLIAVGSGAQPVSWIADLLASADRTLAAPTFMPDGLYLANIDYGPNWNLPVTPISQPVFAL
jgi:tRNA pseudouridine38-40 synthase